RSHELPRFGHAIAGRGAVQKGRREDARLSVHGGRSERVLEAMDGVASDDGERRPHLRVRVPRGELRDDRYPSRRAGGGKEEVTSDGRLYRTRDRNGSHARLPCDGKEKNVPPIVAQTSSANTGMLLSTIRIPDCTRARRSATPMFSAGPTK